MVYIKKTPAKSIIKRKRGQRSGKIITKKASAKSAAAYIVVTGHPNKAVNAFAKMQVATATENPKGLIKRRASKKDIEKIRLLEEQGVVDASLARADQALAKSGPALVEAQKALSKMQQLIAKTA